MCADARVTEVGEQHWQYSRAGLTSEYLTQSPLPAPFNILYYAFYKLPIWLIRKYRRSTLGEELLDNGFKYLPKQRILSSLRRAEQDAVRKFLEKREAESSQEATSMIESIGARLDKLAHDNTAKFEAMNQRFVSSFEQVLRKMDTMGSSSNETGGDDLSWAAPLDGVWHAPPAFTKADQGKSISFSPVTWPIMRQLQHVEKVSRGQADPNEDGYPAVKWNPAYSCHAPLSLVTLTDARGGATEERLISWQGEWSKDGNGGTFAKLLDARFTSSSLEECMSRAFSLAPRLSDPLPSP